MRPRLARSFARFKPRDRDELFLLVGGACLVLLLLVRDQARGRSARRGDAQVRPAHPPRSARPAEPVHVPSVREWLVSAALDITALGSATVLGLTVIAVAGFLDAPGHVAHRRVRHRSPSGGALFVNAALKQFFQRPRPDVVPHLREVMTMSFPSGHALTSAVVYLTLGALSMRIAERRLTKFYCMAMAMLVTVSRRREPGLSWRPLSDRRCLPGG